MRRNSVLGISLLLLIVVFVFDFMPATAQVAHEQCRPEGLYSTPGVQSPYCTVYDADGREKLGPDRTRRVIGYFTSWRHGKNGQPAFLVPDIPWDKVTHINYAFAHVDDNNRISIGDPSNPNNPATGMEWPGVPGAEMDPSLPFKGHFNLLNTYKRQYPNVKLLVSVGGWAETGGYFDQNGNRVANGGFYEMTKTDAGINAFADSVVEFLRTYGFDGVDIDYEYPTSMSYAGNPDDFWISEPQRGQLWARYEVLMRTLREKLDQAGAQDNTHYLLTAAVPASGWLLRGMEDFSVTRYLDFVNIMSYDLHGAWNEYVGHNAALYDTGQDAELIAANVYGAYDGIGYLNTDWAVHYYLGSLPPGRINIGVPFYTRGWQEVTGGTNGLWGTAVLPDQTQCPPGTGLGTSKCGYGAMGIDNLWHDLDPNGNEIFSGTNPMWHAKNLEDGIEPSYLADYGLDPANDPADRLVGDYVRYYDSVAEAPWLWNAQKRVFLSIEDEQSLQAKVEYVKQKGLGGIMIWELAGDYDFYPDRNGGQGEYFMGQRLITTIANGLSNALPYETRRAPHPMPAQAVDIRVDVYDFPLGDNNYPITPKIKFTNMTGTTIPGGARIEFDMPTSTPADIGDMSGWGLQVVQASHTGNNVGGLKGGHHRVAVTVPSWQSWAPGQSIEVNIRYKLPISGPSNYTITINGQTYAFAEEYPRLPVVTPGGGANPTTTPTTSPDPTPPQPTATPTTAPQPTATPTTAPQPTATPTAVPGQCGAPPWDPGAVYVGGDVVSHNGREWRAKWWTQGEEPGTTGEWGVWEDLGPCDGTVPTATPTTAPQPTATPTTAPQPTATPTTAPQPTATATPVPVPPSSSKIIGYFVQWGVYARNYHVKNIVTSGSAEKLTHINYAFANVDANGRCVLGDSYADIDKFYDSASSVDGEADCWDAGCLRGNFNQLRKLKTMYPHLKVLLSVGGWTWSGNFGVAAQNPQAFAESCYQLVHDSRWDGVFDGIDIDWEYPNACGKTCDTSGYDAFRELMKALRQRFGNELVTAAVPAGYDKINVADYGGAAQYVDWYNLMTYDFFGAWEAKGPTAYHAALFEWPQIPQANYYADYAVQLYKSLGVPADKLVLGVPFYGRGWTGVSAGTTNGLGQPASGAAPGTYEAGIEDYKVLKNVSGTVYYGAGTLHKYDGTTFWSYDDPTSLATKQAYRKQEGLGGVMFWELSGDTPDGELIRALYENR